MIVNDDSRVINKLEASLNDDASVIIYDCHMFIVQAIGLIIQGLYYKTFYSRNCFLIVTNESACRSHTLSP